MAEVLEPPGAAPVRLPWTAEVLEPPGAAPVKTWKVCVSAYFSPSIGKPEHGHSTAKF